MPVPSPVRCADALLVVGIHREERAFGEAVASALGRDVVEPLVIADGLPGRHPRADQRFHHEMLHRALYLQLVPHMAGRYRLLIDLHTGTDRLGPSADVMVADAVLGKALRERVAQDSLLSRQSIRFIALGDAATKVRTVIPRQVWDNAGFRYLGIETYLPDGPEGALAAQPLACGLVAAAATCAGIAQPNVR